MWSTDELQCDLAVVCPNCGVIAMPDNTRPSVLIMILTPGVNDVRACTLQLPEVASTLPVLAGE